MGSSKGAAFSAVWTITLHPLPAPPDPTWGDILLFGEYDPETGYTKARWKTKHDSGELPFVVRR